MGLDTKNYWLTVSRIVTLTSAETELRESLESAVEDDWEEMAAR
jgi:hypothetical protein